ncbi:hypothetical protein M436DRAFT_65159 [Aureobasidium namibiae CBS 147.97]|uniref:Uncharacterized protein n=1 Tax=Aureobasidium namibiae CBS 147.97 TaxID=1043004 RepID=A0A074XAN4_9PEZI
MFEVATQHQVRARASHHPSKYRSKRRPGRVYRYGQKQVRQDVSNLDLGDCNDWSEPKGAQKQFLGRRPSPALGIVLRTYVLRAKKPSRNISSQYDGRHTAFMSYDGADDDLLDPLAPAAIGGRARMLFGFPPGDYRADLLPKGRTCCIDEQDLSNETVSISGIKGGKAFEFWMKASNLKMMPETEENTVGFACTVIKEDWCTPRLDRNPRKERLYIYPGDEGLIQKVDNPMWLAQVLIPDRTDSYGNTVCGWFELDSLKVGTAKYGDMSVRFGIAVTRISFSTFGPATTSQFPLTNYFFDFYTGVLRESTALGLPTWILDEMTNASDRYKIAHRLAEGINRAHLTEFFQNPNFTIEDLLGNADDCELGMNDSGGIYGRIYTRFISASKYHKSKHNGQDVWILYVGKASKWGVRLSSYNSTPFRKEDQGYYSTHHITIREARQRDMVMMMSFDPADPNYANLLTYGEQAMMCLLQSWRGKLIADENEFGPKATNFMADTAAAALVKTDAFIMHKVSVQVAEKNNWPGGVLRDSFGALDGLNYNCPLLETKMYQKVLYVVLNAGDRYIYTRGSISFTNKTGIAFEIGIYDHQGKHKRWTIELSKHIKDEFKAKGVTKIYASWERMKRGVAHPAPYFRIPDIVPFTGAEEINTLGLKITWQVKDQWKQMYLQVNQKSTVDASLDGRGEQGWYDMGFNMLYFFKQQMVDNRPSWMHFNQTARLVELRFDHLSQTVTASYPSKPITRVAAPQLKSINTLKAEMEAHGFQNVAQPVGTKVTGMQRKVCDGCACTKQNTLHKYMSPELKDRVNTIGGSVCECTIDPDGRICDTCWELGIPCSFTPSQTLALRDDFYYPVIYMQLKELEICKTIDISDPGFVAFSVPAEH